MAKACRVCGFHQRDHINFAFGLGLAVAEVRRQWRHLSTSALAYHRHTCLGLAPTGGEDERVHGVSAPPAR